MSNDWKCIYKKEWVVEHDWKCVYCQFINRGRDDKCTNCGKNIDEENSEIVPNDMSFENHVTDEKALIDLGPGAPDWICSYCNHRERSRKNSCSECGAIQGEKKYDIDPKKASHSVTPVPRHGTMLPPVKSTTTDNGLLLVDDDLSDAEHSNVTIDVGTGAYRSAKVPNFDNSPSSSSSLIETFPERVKSFLLRNFRIILKVGGIVLGMILVVWFFYWLLAFHNTRVRVAETHWHYHVALYQRQVSSDRSWQGNMHSHAFNVSCTTQIRSHHSCDPYSCNPHQVSYSCQCHQVCHPEESCHTSCYSTGRRSSACREVCSVHNECETTCGTCYRTVYDTCYHSCPDYDQMCSYNYPVWTEVVHADATQENHTIVRPNLVSYDNMTCTGDPEILYIQNPVHSQCTLESVNYSVTFYSDKLVVGGRNYMVQPNTLSEYNRYWMGDIWNAEYNHAGQFHALRNLSR